MASLYPDLISVKAPISTTISTIEGRDVYYVRISDNPNTDEDEVETIYTGIHHAREPVSMMSLLYFMWYLLENYSTDSDIQNLINNTELYFIPVLNPDGYLYNESTNPGGGGLWRKNRRINGGGSIGVDLNRNYGYDWGRNNVGSSGNPFSDAYRGTAPFSEPETQMIREFVIDHDFQTAINNHTFGQYILHPFGTLEDVPAEDDNILYAIGQHMSWQNRYIYGNGVDIIYETNGDSDDWYYGEQTEKPRIYPITPEIGSSAEGGFWPNPSNIVPQCEEMVRSFFLSAYLANNYAIIHDNTPINVTAGNEELRFMLEQVSTQVDDFTVNIQPLTANITSISSNNITTDILSRNEYQEVSTTYTLDANIQTGDPIEFQITLNNGVYDIHTMRIRKYFNAIEAVNETADNNGLSNWSGSWITSAVEAYEGTSSFTEQAGINTPGTRIMTLNDPIDLSGANYAYLEYYIKHRVQRNYDYVTIEVSTNGSSWTKLCGKHTKPGSRREISRHPDSNQPTGEPLYDGRKLDWVREEIDLSDYLGESEVYIRFYSYTSGSEINEEGFYLDQLSVVRNPLTHCEDGVQNEDEEGVDCGGVDCRPCPSCSDGIQNGDEEDVDCGGSNCAPCPFVPCPPIDFNDYTIQPFGGQDNGQFDIQENGDALFTENNAWKAIALSYEYTSNTVIEFEFKSTEEGELHEFILDTDLNLGGSTQRFLLHGFQPATGLITDFSYSGSGEFETFQIPMSNYTTGTYNYIVFTCDNDASPTVGNSTFRNVRIFEDLDGDLACDDLCQVGDSDGDGVCDDEDICNGGDDTVDSDGDGTPDFCDVCPDSATDDSDGDGVCDNEDICAGGDDNIDADGDGVPDFCDACPDSATGDSDGDGVCDNEDICAGGDDNIDADGDGVPDFCDACPDSATGDTDGDGVCDNEDVCAGGDDTLDSDGDGTPNDCDVCPDSATDDSDGDGVCDNEDICPGGDDTIDSDGDGIPDACDPCSDSASGDSDGDGVCDDVDICPGGDDNTDTDGDGTPNFCDACPDSATGDSDGDGICDNEDVCPDGDDSVDTDGDGIPNDCDLCPDSATGDTDGDGVCDNDDICNGGDDNVDSDLDGVPDFCDSCPGGDDSIDSDGDGVCDLLDECPGSDDALDRDDDGIPDGCDVCPDSATGDSDGDGVCDNEDVCAGGDDNIDSDGDGTPDFCDTCPDSATGDSDGDGVCDNDDVCDGGDDTQDSDGDGTPDDCDACPDSATGDSDGDGVCDNEDICDGGDDTIDADGNGIPDACENDCPLLDFNQDPIISYDPNQDFGTAEVQDNGATAFIENNAWKAVDVNYTLTTNTVLEFDFRSTLEGELHEIYFDTDLVLGNSAERFLLYGFQPASSLNQEFQYSGSGNFEHFTIPIGEYNTGVFRYLVITADNDATGTGNSYFSNIQIYEDANGDGICDEDTGCTSVTIDTEDFENGWGIWNDGGSDCRRSINDQAFANSGSYCVRLRDNTSTSVTTTDNLDLTSYSSVDVSFSYIAQSMDNASEDFWLQLSTDGGTSYTTIEEWNQGDEFVNGVRENDLVTINGPFSAITRLRFRCDASGNSDWVYLDDIVIEGCQAGSARQIVDKAYGQKQSIISDEVVYSVYPNPTTAYYGLDITMAHHIDDVSVSVFDQQGRLVSETVIRAGQTNKHMSLDRLRSGTYYIHFVSDQFKGVRKIVLID